MLKIKTLILIIIISMLSTFTHVLAKDLPNEFWALNDSYNSSLKTHDNYAIIDYATQITDLIQNEPQTSQTVEIMGSRLLELALAYERVGDFVKAGQIHLRYLPYGEKLGWADGIKIAKAKILQYTNTIDLYTPTTTTQKNYNAKNEPTMGVLYGATSDGTIREHLPNESMILLYQEFNNVSKTDMWWLDKIMTEANEKGISVEFAWNLPYQGNQVADVVNQTDYIISVLNEINKFPTVPVFLRFGAEMNIWDNKADPTQFKEAFAHVSRLSKQYAPNVAMVWSVNQVSSWDIEINDYYPGDEFVDWVGISSYIQPHFLGRNDWSEDELFNEVVFLAGNSADPVKALTEVIEKYGDRKPIMLAESGVSHYVRTLNKACSEWAILNMKKMYNYVPMVYPQVKLIAYFDKVMPEEVNDYALSTNKQMSDLYTQLVGLPAFIQSDSKSAIAYSKINDDMSFERKNTELNAYIHIFGKEQLKVDYYIDDTWVNGSTVLPYKVNIDFGNYEQGKHKLSVVVEDNGVFQGAKSYTISLNGNTSISTKEYASKLVLDNVAHSVNLYNIFGNSYFKLRDISFVLNNANNIIK